MCWMKMIKKALSGFRQKKKENDTKKKVSDFAHFTNNINDDGIKC